MWLTVSRIAGALIGAGLAVLAVVLGGIPALLVLVVVLAFAPLMWVRFGLPRLVLRQTVKLLEPASGPPAGARPVANELPHRIDEFLTARDWDGLRSRLADDFALVDPNGRRFNASLYVKTCKTMARAYPDLRQTTDEVLADPDEPHVLWSRATTVGRPRGGPALDTTAWTRMTISPDGERVREMANGGVIRVA